MTAAPGGFAEHFVEILFGQVGKVDAAELDHAGQLARGDDDIHIRDAVMPQFGTGGLELLGRAGHDRDDHDILRIDAGLFGIVGFDDRAFHLVRDLQEERLGRKSGYWCSQNLIQPGEQEVIMGSTPPVF